MANQKEMINTLSGPVDVLAEMQADIDALEQRVLAGEFTLSRGYDKVNRLRELRAAVAELIEAGGRAAIAACRGDDFHPGTIRNVDLDALRAAVANVGGAK